jgi:hypothetical protein
MAEILIGLGVMTVGYLFSQNDNDKKSGKKDNSKRKKSSRGNSSRKEKFTNYNSQPQPYISNSGGNIPPSCEYPALEQKQPNDTITNTEEMVESLTGQRIKKSEFTHLNMQPFYSGRLKQNINPRRNQSILDNHTGAASLQFSKREIEPLFKNDQPNMGLPIGAPNKTQEMREYVESTLNQVIRKDNELPFDQIRTGPGLNKGYTNEPSGGFNQPEKNEILKRYMNVDEMRVATNPKHTYKGRVLPAKGINTERGINGEVRKYKPDDFYINKNGERNLVTTGAYIKDRVRPQPVDKSTARAQTTVDYYGAGGGNKDQIAGHTFQKEQYDHTMLNVQQLGAQQMGPAVAVDTSRQNASAGKGKDGKGDVGDYGRSGYTNKKTERTYTEPRNHGLNITREVKSIIAPLLDIFRRTRKENVIGNPRPYGNFGNTGPSAQVYFDPNDTTRTTIREITGNTDYIGAPTNVDQKEAHYYDPTDIAKPTVRETTASTNYMGAPTNVDQHEIYYFDPTDIAKPTVRETTAGTNYVGGANYQAHTGDGGGYKTANYVMDPTNRQTTQNNEYVGIAKSDDAPTSYEASYNAHLNPNKEDIARGRAPTAQGPKVNLDKGQYKMQFKKHDYDYMQHRVPAPSNMATTVPNTSLIGEMSGKMVLDMDISKRNEPVVVSQFEANPYTQPLNSMAAY